MLDKLALRVMGLAFVLISVADNHCLAQATYTWTQAAGGAQSWNNAANWAGGVPSPVAGDIITMNMAMLGNTSLALEADRTFGKWSGKYHGFNGTTFTINSGNVITFAGTDPTIELTQGTLVFLNVVAGTSGLTKTGGGTLDLRNDGNTFTGGLELAAGTLKLSSDGPLGSPANPIDVTGDSSLNLASGTYAIDVAISNGVVLSLNERQDITISGSITGEGGISLLPRGHGSASLTLTSTGNTFTGPIVIGYDSRATFTVNSLADSAHPLTLYLSNKGPTTFIWGAGAIAPLALDSRQVILGGNQTVDHVIQNDNVDTNNTITINRDVSVTSTTARKLILQGVNTGDNTIAGIIPNGASDATTSLEKKGAGTWVLSGDNTYSGNTTVSGGLLALADSSCLLDSGTLTINGGKLRLDRGVRERVDNLVLGSTTQTASTSYGSLSSSAKIKSDTYFSGAGLLYLGMDPPPFGTVLIIK